MEERGINWPEAFRTQLSAASMALQFLKKKGDFTSEDERAHNEIQKIESDLKEKSPDVDYNRPLPQDIQNDLLHRLQNIYTPDDQLQKAA